MFIAPGILGTVLGVSLTSIAGVTQENILVQALAVTGNAVELRLLFFFAIAAAMMSLIDGLLIAGGYAIIVDLLSGGRGLAELDADEERATRIMSLIRLALVVLAAMAAWGVHALTAALGLSAFDTVYLVIVPQLALTGPVLIGLSRRGVATGARGRLMVWAIVVALVVGLGMTWVGTTSGMSKLVDGAGTAAAAVSLLLAFSFSGRRREEGAA